MDSLSGIGLGRERMTWQEDRETRVSKMWSDHHGARAILGHCPYGLILLLAPDCLELRILATFYLYLFSRGVKFSLAA